MGQKYPHLPKVVYVDMVQCQGLMHDTYVYGLNVKGILSTMIGPPGGAGWSYYKRKLRCSRT